MNKDIKAFLIFLISIFIGLFFWDLIEFSNNSEKLEKKFFAHHLLYNPLNDPVRFIIFLGIPILLTSIYYQKEDSVFLKRFNEIIFFNKLFKFKNKEKNNHGFVNFYLALVILTLIIEFLILDFNIFASPIDIFHEGMWLTASKNVKITGEFWKSSYIIRGYFADFYPFFLWDFFNKETIGITRLFQAIIFFLNKILLVFIIFKISSFITFSKYKRNLFFLTTTLIMLSLQSYINPIFPIRSFLLLLFILTFLNFLQKNKNILFIFALGIFSSLSCFWYIDIALYVNVILIALLIYLLINYETKPSAVLILSILSGWLALYLIFPKSEFIEFLNNTYSVFTTLSWFHGIQFPKPFISLDARSGKALVIFLLIGFFLIQLINQKKKNNLLFLMSILFLFIISLLYFNYGLSRSDSGHIRIATSFAYIPFISLVLYYVISRLDLINNKKEKITNFLNISLIVVIFSSSVLVEKKYEKKNLKNILSAKSSIVTLINYDDSHYINSDYIDFINYYESLTSDDSCTTIFTNEAALFYLLKKKSCSKYYFMWSSFPKEIQKKLILDLKNYRPNFIIYTSEKDIFNNSINDIKNVNQFILSNYYPHQKFKGWDIYKLK